MLPIYMLQDDVSDGNVFSPVLDDVLQLGPHLAVGVVDGRDVTEDDLHGRGREQGAVVLVGLLDLGLERLAEKHDS